MATIEWTKEFEEKLRKKLEDEYSQVADMVEWASHSDRPLKRSIVRIQDSADSLLKWIKKELSI